VPVERAKEFQARFIEFLSTTKSDLLARMARQPAVDDELTTMLRAANDEFARMWA
jgi:hypothetical protein